MSINHDGLRIEVARAMYDDSIGHLKGAPSWFEQSPQVRDGFLKLATVCFVTLWKKDVKDLVAFWCDHAWKSVPGCGNRVNDDCCGDRINSKKIVCSECKMEALLHDT